MISQVLTIYIFLTNQAVMEGYAAQTALAPTAMVTYTPSPAPANSPPPVLAPTYTMKQCMITAWHPIDNKT